MSDAAKLKALATWLDPLTWTLEPKQRRVLMAIVIREVRSANMRSMRAQTAPDGTPWKARRARIMRQHGVRESADKAKKRNAPMMAKLRLAKSMYTKTTPEEAAMGFVGKVMRVARVHHYGLPDLIKAGGPTHVYDERPLIGISDETIDKIKTRILTYLAGSVQKK